MKVCKFLHATKTHNLFVFIYVDVMCIFEQQQQGGDDKAVGVLSFFLRLGTC